MKIKYIKTVAVQAFMSPPKSVVSPLQIPHKAQPEVLLIYSLGPFHMGHLIRGFKGDLHWLCIKI